MGATTVMMTTGTPELPRNVIAAIAESGYTSARMEFIDSARGMFHMPKLLASACVDAAGLICKRRAGYDFTEAPAYRHCGIRSFRCCSSMEERTAWSAHVSST